MKIKAALLALVVALLVPYGVCVFVSLNPNVLTWSEDGRMWLVLMSLWMFGTSYLWFGGLE